MRWFEVALWRRWPALFPDCTAKVWAWDAFSAVEYAMRRYRLALVDYAAVYAEDHALIYRAHKIAVLRKRSRFLLLLRRWLVLMVLSLVMSQG